MDDKSRFDAILELNKQCWERMFQRRVYEWRVAFALWGAAIGLIGLLFTSELKEKNIAFWGVVASVVAIGIAISLLHLFWLRGLNNAMSTDRKMAIYYAGILQQISESQFLNELNQDLRGRQDRLSSFWTSWSVVCEWLATNILVLTALLVASFRIWA